MKALAGYLIAFVLLSLTSCGGGSTPVSSGPLTGNWQFTLSQNYPRPVATIAISGFLSNPNTETVSGSLQVPTFGANNRCGGASVVNGSLSGQDVTFSINSGGTVFNLTGTIASGNASMSGTYQAPGGACLTDSTTGAWTASLIPPLNGNFTGTLTDSTYMALLTGLSPAAPIAVSGTITQSTNADASNATLTGTITAVDYPCFSTASVSGTISGQNVYLNVFGYNGDQIGFLGEPSASPGVAGTPATVTTGSTGVTLTGTGTGGLSLGGAVGNSVGGTGPCPPLGPENILYDATSVSLTFQ